MADWNVDKLFYDCSHENSDEQSKREFEPFKVPALPRPPPSTDDILLSQAFRNTEFSPGNHVSSSQSDSRKGLPSFQNKKFPPTRIGIVTPSTVSSQRSCFKAPFKQPSQHVYPVASDKNDNGADADYFDSTYTSQHHTETPNVLQKTVSSYSSTITPQPLQVQGSNQGQLNLRSRSEIPEEFHGIFDFPYFNAVQSKVFDDVLYSDKALVVCAPTGSGKTVIFELAIIRLLLLQKSQQFEAKVIYMAPVKALCSERYEDWNQKFSQHGLKCMELTGDTDMDSYFDMQNVNIIFTTPEKWDSMTRRWRDNKSMVHYVRLFLIDEVHLLTEDSRGATMEAVVSRMKTVQAAAMHHHKDSTQLRFVAVSATIPNVEDVAGWLSTSETPAIYHKMDESLRPVHLRKVVLGYNCSDSTSEFKFDITLNYKLASVIETYSNKKPTLVFCATRKSVMQGASTLASDAKFILNAKHKLRLQSIANSIKDSKLRDLVMGGIAYHHAGLDMHDRKTVEMAFGSGDIPVLLATSTLAMGVNLPAHLVVIKSTMHYVMGCYQEYADSQIQQMIGRAGRPQFDTSATAVIMTRMSTKYKYDAMIGGAQLVESSLHKSLIEHLNAEIVLTTISDVQVALQWLKSTFLFIRVMKNPKHYGIPTGLKQEDVDQKLQDLCLTNLRQLADIDLVKIEQEQLIPTDSGRLMARYCVAFETMKNFSNLQGNESMDELMTVFCNSEEFKDIQLRTNEKRILNMLNKDKNRPTIRYPLNGKIKTTEMKVNCLIQTALGSLSLQEFSLQQDTNKIFKAAKRVARCLVEVLWMKTNFQSLLNAILLDKCINARLWENSRHVSRQLTGIGPAISNALVNQGLVDFEKLERANPRDIELIVNRHAPFGTHVHEAVVDLPKYEVHVEQSTPYSASQCELTVNVDIVNKDAVSRKSTAHRTHQCSLLIGSADGKVILKTRISDGILLRNGPWSKKTTIQRSEKGEELSIHLISQDWVGLDIQSSYTPVFTGPRKLTATTTCTRGETPKEQEIMQALPEGHRPCSHKCLNKETCAHDCCKVGIAVKATPVQRAMQDMKSRLKTFSNSAGPSTPGPGNLQCYAYARKKIKMPVATGWADLDLLQSRRQPTKERGEVNDPLVVVEDFQNTPADHNYLPDLKPLHPSTCQQQQQQQLVKGKNQCNQPWRKQSTVNKTPMHPTQCSSYANQQSNFYSTLNHTNNRYENPTPIKQTQGQGSWDIDYDFTHDFEDDTLKQKSATITTSALRPSPASDKRFAFKHVHPGHGPSKRPLKAATPETTPKRQFVPLLLKKTPPQTVKSFQARPNPTVSSQSGYDSDTGKKEVRFADIEDTFSDAELADMEIEHCEQTSLGQKFPTYDDQIRMPVNLQCSSYQRSNTFSGQKTRSVTPYQRQNATKQFLVEKCNPDEFSDSDAEIARADFKNLNSRQPTRRIPTPWSKQENPYRQVTCGDTLIRRDGTEVLDQRELKKPDTVYGGSSGGSTFPQEKHEEMGGNQSVQNVHSQEYPDIMMPPDQPATGFSVSNLFSAQSLQDANDVHANIFDGIF